jgi:hypothetical protein
MAARLLPLGRPVGNVVVTMPPSDIAVRRAARLTDAVAHDRELFMAWFARGRSDEQNGADTWMMFRGLLDANPSVDVAGYLEGVASVRADRIARPL